MTDPRQRPRGLLTDEVQARCVEALRGAAYVKDACAFAGIDERRYHEWVQRGYLYEQILQDGGDIIANEEPYLAFAKAVDLARAEARVSASHHIRRAWQEDGDWRAALAYLERSDPQHWGKVNRVEMTGRDGGPIEVDVTAIERSLAERIRNRPLIIDADEVTDSVVPQLMPAAAVAAVAADDDDDDDYFLVVPSVLDYGSDDLWPDSSS